MSIAETIQKIEAAGFHLVADGADLIVQPPGKLSEQQRGYLKAHKAEIIAALRSSETLLEAGQPGDDLPAANDRITVHVPEFTLGSGSCVSFDLDLPRANLPGLRQSIRFELKDGQGGGSILGKPGASVDEVRDVLLRKYAGRVATIDGAEVAHG